MRILALITMTAFLTALDAPLATPDEEQQRLLPPSSMPTREPSTAQSPPSGTIPLFRLLSPQTGDHLYTTSVAERDNVIAKFGYQSEGIAGYVFASQAPGATPLFRLLNLKTGHHFYTTSKAELQKAVASLGYKDEGIACEVFGSEPSQTEGRVPGIEAHDLSAQAQKERQTLAPWVDVYLHPGISLSVDGTEPMVVWENQDFVVDYTVFNNTNRTIDGMVAGTFAGGNLVPVGSPSIHLTSGQSVKGKMQTHVYYGPSAGAHGIILTYSGGEQHCVPRWPSGQICLFADSATGSLDIIVQTVGETLVSLDSLPPQAQAGGMLCNNSTYPSASAPNEWVTTPNGLDVPISGRVVNFSLPNHDVAWDHPFGCDYWFNLLPDTPYWDLLNDPDIAAKADCSANGFAKGTGDRDLCASFQILENDRARASETYKGLAGIGVLHTEMEDRLVPSSYRALLGDRVYMRGKRIVDCGHNDFTSEMHPPTVFAKATLDQNTGNVASTLLFLPYRTLQTYQTGNLNFIQQLAGQLVAVATVPAPIPVSFHPNISTLPSDQPLLAHYRVSIPTVKGNFYAALQYHFVVRPGVTVNVKRFNNYQVDVEVSYDPKSYTPPAPPLCWNSVITFEDADKQAGEAPGTFRGLVNGLMPLWLGLVPNPMIAASLDMGFSTSACMVPGTIMPPYDMKLDHGCQIPPNSTQPSVNNPQPQAPDSILDNKVVVDATQPFPAYGWLDLKWSKTPVLTSGGILPPK